ncbi:MAG: hypothetical protein IH591_12810 [Bacteroidales bacterium]|nr:hypothetical protein [Bacteroidales bacterium]
MRILSVLLFIAGTGLFSAAQPVSKSLAGFFRSGVYCEFNPENGNDIFSSIYGDVGAKADLRNDKNFRAYADIRYRYGSEFRSTVSDFQLREAWISLFGRKFELIMGQRIVKWGRADFDNPTSSFNPRNLIVRSPEKEDMDLGNISASLIFKPSGIISLEAIVTPLYRPDVLITSVVGLPDIVVIEDIDGLQGGEGMAGYGIKADFFLKGADLSLSWFNGNEPLPGLLLSDVSVAIVGEVPDIDISMSVTPYRVSRLGFDFEAVAGRFGIRGEASWTRPEMSFREYGYVPMPEIEWASGTDIMIGDFMIGAEYIGKYITDYETSPVDPVVPGEIPALTPEQIAMIPGGIEGYISQQTTAFNRLYMYQLERSYHSVGLRAEADLLTGRLTPGINGLYNFTTGDLVLVPSIKVSPADGLLIIAGADIYNGREGSLYDIIERRLSNWFFSMRVVF